MLAEKSLTQRLKLAILLALLAILMFTVVLQSHALVDMPETTAGEHYFTGFYGESTDGPTAIAGCNGGSSGGCGGG